MIITPHPAELSRICNVDTSEIQNNRIKYAKKVACENNIIVVLKGANTVIANSNGEVFINTNGNSGMATAGSGDVLAGIMSSLVAQGVSPYTSAKSATYIHWLCGDIAKNVKGELSMLPTDMIEILPQVLKK